MGEVLVLNASGAMSDEALAASQLGFVIFGLMAYGLDGFAHAVEALVGEAIGKKDALSTLRRAILESTILAAMTALLTSLLIAITSSTFLHFMTDIPEVITIAEDIYFLDHHHADCLNLGFSDGWRLYRRNQGSDHAQLITAFYG